MLCVSLWSQLILVKKEKVLPEISASNAVRNSFFIKTFQMIYFEEKFEDLEMILSGF